MKFKAIALTILTSFSAMADDPPSELSVLFVYLIPAVVGETAQEKRNKVQAMAEAFDSVPAPRVEGSGDADARVVIATDVTAHSHEQHQHE